MVQPLGSFFRIFYKISRFSAKKFTVEKQTNWVVKVRLHIHTMLESFERRKF